MDASQYKDYVLTLLFMKYVSDKNASDPDALIDVPDGGGFDDMAKLKGDKEIGDRINKIISRLAEANELKGVIDKEDAAARKGIFMVDASRGFIKDGNKNRLREQDIHRMVDVFTRQTEVPGYSRLVLLPEIADPANDYNLNLPRYVDSSEPEDLHDLDAHLHGGIPNRDIDALDEYWTVFPAMRDALFRDGERAGYTAARIETREVRAAILEHEDFQFYAGLVKDVVRDWCEIHESRLLNINAATQPKSVISALSEDLLRRFSGLELLDAYDIYQCLMDYWNETMQDDIYLVVGEGWFSAAQPRGIIDDRKRKLKETPDLIVKRRKYKLDLIPPALVVARYFAAEERTLGTLQETRDIAARDLDGLVEEHTGEEGLLEGAVNDKGKLTKASVSARLKAIRAEPGSADERQTLERGMALVEAESKASMAVKEAQADLDAQVLARYAALSKREIKSLVIEDKWLASIRAAIDAQVQRLAQRLSARIMEIEDRYTRPLPELERDVEAFSAKVSQHLVRMGIAQ